MPLTILGNWLAPFSRSHFFEAARTRAQAIQLFKAGVAGDEQVLGSPDPTAVGEVGEDGAVDAAGRAQVGVLDAGGVAESRELQPGGETAAVAFGGLAVDEQAEALLEGHGLAGRDAALLVERPGHAGQAEGEQAVAGGVGEHGIHLLLQ